MGMASAGSRTSILVLSVLTLLFVAVASWMVGRLGDTATPAHAEEPEARSEAVALDVSRSDPAPFVGVAFPEELLADLVREVRLLREEIAGLRESESTRTPVSVDRSTEVKQNSLAGSSSGASRTSWTDSESPIESTARTRGWRSGRTTSRTGTSSTTSRSSSTKGGSSECGEPPTNDRLRRAVQEPTFTSALRSWTTSMGDSSSSC